MHGRTIMTTIAALVVLLAACATDDAAVTPLVDPDPTTVVTSASTTFPAPAPLSWVQCGDLECATMTVPLDYDRPTAGTIPLAVARKQSSGDDPVGALVVNPGGPGGSGINYLRNGAVNQLLPWFDLVSWDPRGVGNSRPLDCAKDTAFLDLDPQPDDAQERDALERAARSIADECAAVAPDLLPTLTTENSARDVEQLRRALGDQPLTYLGFSYGTNIGLTYASLFPDQVRAMTLDGVVDPRETLTEFLTGQATEMQRLLGDNLSRYNEVAERVETDRLPSRTGESVGPGRLGVAAFASIYGANGESRLSQALDDGLAGDGTALAQLADGYIGTASFAAYLGVLCVDGPHPSGASDWSRFIDDIMRAAPDVGPSVGNEVLPCAYWSVPPATGEPTVSWPPTLPPILLVASTEDAATPLDDAARVNAAVPNSVLLVRDGPGHTSFRASSCIADAVQAYLVDLQPPDEGTICES